MKNFKECRERDSNPHSHYWPRDFKSLVSTNSTIAAWYTLRVRAENGTRTRDPTLGKVVLYQLSYFRIVASAKVMLFLHSTKRFTFFKTKNPHFFRFMA